MDNLLLAFALTAAAGLATGLGGLVVLARRTGRWSLSLGLGFSAGVMLYVSFLELFPDARRLLVGEFGEGGGPALTAGACSWRDSSPAGPAVPRGGRCGRGVKGPIRSRPF